MRRRTSPLGLDFGMMSGSCSMSAGLTGKASRGVWSLSPAGGIFGLVLLLVAGWLTNRAGVRRSGEVLP